MTTVIFRFSIGDSVRLKEIDRPAIVSGLLKDREGQQCKVEYWNDGERKVTWVFDFEIEPT